MDTVSEKKTVYDAASEPEPKKIKATSTAKTLGF